LFCHNFVLENDVKSLFIASSSKIGNSRFFFLLYTALSNQFDKSLSYIARTLFANFSTRKPLLSKYTFYICRENKEIFHNQNRNIRSILLEHFYRFLASIYNEAI